MRRSQICDVKADEFRRRRQRVGAPHPAPAGELGPVLGISLHRVLGDRLAGIVPRGFHQPVERARARDMGRKGKAMGFALVPFVGSKAIWRC